MKKLLAAAILVGLILLGQGTAYAIPILQLYTEGAYYDETTETWVWDPSLSDGPPRLWAIGNVAGPGNAGPISEVKLAVAYDAVFQDHITVTLLPTLIGGTGTYEGFSASPPDAFGSLVGIEEEEPGTIPKLSDGRDLPQHGAYGPGVIWMEFSLGDFSDQAPTDSIADFIAPEPYEGPDPFDITGIDEIFDTGGRIKAYEVSVSIVDPDDILPSLNELHFDLYNSVQAGTKAKFSPFSHDAVHTPEPASFIVWFLIGLSWAGSAWTYQYRRRWRKWQQEEAAGSTGMGGLDQADRFTGSAMDRFEGQVDIRPAGPWAAHRPSR